MKARGMLLTAALCGIGAITALGQGQGQPADSKRTPGVQAGQDPNRAAFVAANCKNPAPAPAARGGGAPGAPGAPGGGGAPGGPGGGGAPGGAGGGARGGGGAAPPAAQEYTVTEIP